MKREKTKVAVSAELHNAHMQLLKVTTKEHVAAIREHLELVERNIDSGDLQRAHERLEDINRAAWIIRKEVLHSAKQLDVSLHDADDDDDD